MSELNMASTRTPVPFLAVILSLFVIHSQYAQGRMTSDDRSNDASAALTKLIMSKLSPSKLIQSSEFSNGTLVLRMAIESEPERAQIIEQVMQFKVTIEESLELKADSIKEVLIKPPVLGKQTGAISVPSAASQIQNSNPATSDLRNKSGAALAQVIQPNVQAMERERPIQQLLDEQGHVIVRREGMINLALRQLKARNGFGLVNTGDHLARSALSPGDRADAHRLKSLGYFFSGDLEQCQKELLIARSFGGESSRFYFFLEGFQGIDRIRFSQIVRNVGTQKQ